MYTALEGSMQFHLIITSFADRDYLKDKVLVNLILKTSPFQENNHSDFEINFAFWVFQNWMRKVILSSWKIQWSVQIHRNIFTEFVLELFTYVVEKEKKI